MNDAQERLRRAQAKERERRKDSTSARRTGDAGGKQRAKGGRSPRVLGEQGEAMVKARLESLGYCMVERIHTNIRQQLQRPCKTCKSTVRKSWHESKVSGDFTAIERGTGRKVLVEAKLRSEDRLLHSDLKPHQVRALDENKRHGGTSLLVWVFAPEHLPTEVFVMRWPVEGFVKRTSLLAGRARVLNMELTGR